MEQDRKKTLYDDLEDSNMIKDPVEGEDEKQSVFFMKMEHILDPPSRMKDKETIKTN